MSKDDILLGAGEVYMYEFIGEAIPEHNIIETEDHNVGHTSGGASIAYKPKKYDVENSYGRIVKSFITKEEITFKTGLLTWVLDNISLLSTAKITTDKTKKTKTLTFGGVGSLKNVLVRFVHVKDNGKKLRFTMIGQGGNGFSLKFEDKEVTVDAEITAIEYIKNFLASFEEELTDEEALAIYTLVVLADGSLGIAGDKTITGLTVGKTYKVTITDLSMNTVIKYTDATGALVEEVNKAALGAGVTSIIGLTNGYTYDVDEVVI